MSKICFGCGVKLQSSNEDGLGYVPASRIDDAKYCQRCFKMEHYGIKTSASTPKSTESIIKTVNKNAEYVVFCVDFIDIFDDVMNIFASIKAPKVLVVSKSDIIPKNVSFSQIKSYLRTIYRVRDEIIFTSMVGNLNTLFKNIYDKNEVYFLGLTNSGKSTLINSIMDKMNAKASKLTTSFKENTTQDFVRIKVGDKTLIDSPGFVIDNFEVNKLTNVSNEIKPITYQNKTSCTYKIGDLFKIRIKDNTNAIFYFSKNIDITRLYKNETIGVTFSVKGNSDIVVCGLGFIKVTHDTTVVIPNEIMKYINIRPSLVGGVYEQD